MRVYGRTRLRGVRGVIARPDGREVKPLPGRAKDESSRNWKWMFRISSNWRRGMVTIRIVDNAAHFSGRCLVEPMLQRSLREQDSHIIIAGTTVITAPRCASQQPTVTVVESPRAVQTFKYEREDDSPAAITTLCLDQSPESSSRVSLACFLSTGDFSIFQFNPRGPFSATRIFNHTPRVRRPRSTGHVVQAAFYYPLIVTLSEDFTLSVYDLSSGSVRQTQSLKSFTSYPPSSLVLSAPTPTTFKIVLAYSIPVYPHHWSAGASELIISNDPTTPSAPTSPLSTQPSFAEEFRLATFNAMNVVASRTIRAIDVPSGWIDEQRLHLMREQWSRKVISVADTQTDGKWLILAPGDGPRESSASPFPSPSSSNTTPQLHSSPGLQLYRLVFPTQRSSGLPSPPRLTFVRTLHGQRSAVSALAVADGRCVSLGYNGSIWVWDLEHGTGAEVAPAIDNIDASFLAGRGTVSFDDRQIVTSHLGQLAVRRFDV